MENKYLAKTENQKTIKEHTNDLLQQYKILKELYPKILLKEEWEILEYAIKYHDIGKINTKFQNKIYKKLEFTDLLEDKVIDEKEIYHNFVSPLFIDTKYFLEKYKKELTKILVSSIYYHHDREEKNYNLEKLVQDLNNQLKNFGDFYNLDLKVADNYPFRYVVKPINIANIKILISKPYIMIKGILNKLDYVASLDKNGVNVEETVFDIDKLGISDKIKNITKEKYKNNFRPVQKYMLENKDENLIVISPTGSGKTEASLLWADNKKLFYTLPLKVSINAIYERIIKNIDYSKAVLLHSDAYSYYLDSQEKDEKPKENTSILYDRAERLSSPLIVSTVDQLFKIAFRYNGYEEILSTLAYSKIIIDEIQMYSPTMLAYILIGLKMITDIGGKFAIVTATFPPVLYDLMDKLEIPYKKQNKYFQMHLKNRHKIQIFENSKIDTKLIKEFAKNKKVLVIVNTVRKAQELYEELKHEKVYLLHSNYIKEDRKLLEDSILEFTSKENKEKGIWISTQIVEASLDIDFDVLFTDMCSIDSLFQRMGRVYRKREYDEEIPNVYIYDTKNGIMGSKPIIDPEIYKYSLIQILKYNNTNLSEENKQNIINNIFDVNINKELEESKYYIEINKTIELFKETIPNEIQKELINKLFRDIQSISLIPDNIYEKLDNDGKIETWKNILSKSKVKNEKIKVKDEINKNTVSVSFMYQLLYDKDELFYKGSNIHRTQYKYEFDKKTLKGRGLIKEKTDNQSNFY